MRLEKLLLAAEEAVERAGGRLDPPQGHSLLAVFGATGVHEDDPERAVTAALRIAEEMRAAGIGATVGIATGEAYVGPLNGTVPVAVTGAVVNRARRLQSVGGLSGLLVDRATWQRTRHSFLYDALPLAVGDTPAHRPRRPLPRPRKSRGIDGMETRLIGRDGEVKRLSDALAAAANQSGRFVALTGEAGIGKSRLVAALTTSQAAAGVLWLEGRCTEMGSATAFGPFVDLLESHFSRQANIHREEKVGRIVNPTYEGSSSHLEGELAPAVGRELAGLVAASRLGEDEAGEMAALFTRLLGRPDAEAAGDVDAQQMQYRTMRAVSRFVAALCQEQPVALVLDDLHWADSLSLDLAGQLLETAASHRLFLLAVYRDDGTAALHRLEQSAQRVLGRRAEVLPLTPFSPEESGAFLAALLGTDSLPAELVATVADKAQGNPFFTEEIVRELLESGALTPGQGGGKGQNWRVLPVPSTVQSVILSRLHRLAPVEQELLLWAAVIGARFEIPLLVEAASLPPSWEESLWRLEEAGFVYLLRSFPQTLYAFRHALGQEAIYASLSEKGRKAMHRQVGEAIERLYPERLGERTADLAHHFDRADADEKALGYLLQEGEQALAAYLNEEAVRAFQRALARLGRADRPAASAQAAEQQLALLIRMGKTQSILGSYSEANAALRQAIDIGKRLSLSTRDLARLHWWLGEALFSLQDASGYAANAAEGLRLLGDDIECVEGALMLQISAIALLFYGEEEAAARRVERLDTLLLRMPYCADLRPAYGLMGKHFALFAKETERGAGWFSALEKAARAGGDGKAVAEAQSWRSIQAICQGDQRAAVREIEDSLNSARQIRSRQFEAAALGMLQRLLLAGGDLTRLASVAKADQLAAQEVDDKNRERVAALLHAIGQICAGGFPTPAAACRHLQTVAAHPPASFQCEFHLRLGQLFGALGESALAQTQLERALALAPVGTAAQWRVITHYSPPFLPVILAALQANGTAPARYTVLCQSYRADNPAVESSSLRYWSLQPAQPDAHFAALSDGADGLTGPEWQWIDPFGDCACEMDGGLSIHAANCRDLWHINWSAPRYVRPVVGDFAAETVCLPAHPERPAIGGLLLWQDEHNFLRLTRNAFGPGSVAFLGALGKKDVVIGLGHLPAIEPECAIHLRLERWGEQVRALCSADGVSWYSVGHVAFPAGDAQVGLHAIGNIDRCAFPGAHPQGSAIRFQRFGLMSQEPPHANWPEGYAEEVSGGWQGEPLERPPQGSYESRSELM